MIVFENLTKKFGDNLVLDKINLTIKAGEIVGFLGPNGAGKTTTMRLLTGFLKPTAGKILINGQAVNAENKIDFKRQLGYLPENNPLYNEMLVFEYLRLIAELKQIKAEKIDSAIRQAVKKTGLEAVYYKVISDLSKGYKQRVGLAASILGTPKILILDEPTEGLDPNQRIDIRNLIKNLGQDKTVIVSSHVLSEIENTCSRIVIINKGKIVANGPTHEVIAGSRGKQRLNLEIEGQHVEAAITKLLSAGQTIKTVQRQGNKVSLVLSLPAKDELRPKIFNLAREHNWVIWEMHRQESTLEDVFKALTK